MTVFKATLLSLRSFSQTIIIYFLVFAIFAVVRAKVSSNSIRNFIKVDYQGFRVFGRRRCKDTFLNSVI